MEEIKIISLLAYDWLKDKDPKNWSRTSFKTRLICDILLNNLCEAFNSVIFGARDKHIITMLEIKRRYIGKRIETKIVEGSKWKHGVGARIWKIFEKTQKEAISLNVTYFGAN